MVNISDVMETVIKFTPIFEAEDVHSILQGMVNEYVDLLNKHSVPPEDVPNTVKGLALIEKFINAADTLETEK